MLLFLPFFSNSCFAFVFSFLRTKCILPTKRQRALLCLQSGLRRRRIQLHRYLCTKVSSMLICPRCLPWQQKYYAVDYVIPSKNTKPVENRENPGRRAMGVQRWRSGESTRLPPLCTEFDSHIRRHMWVEFVGSLLCTERFSPGTPVFPLKNQHFTWFVLIVNFIVSKAVS